MGCHGWEGDKKTLAFILFSFSHLLLLKESSCHADSCPVERPRWHWTEGSLQPQLQRPEVPSPMVPEVLIPANSHVSERGYGSSLPWASNMTAALADTWMVASWGLNQWHQAGCAGILTHELWDSACCRLLKLREICDAVTGWIQLPYWSPPVCSFLPSLINLPTEAKVLF